MALDPAGLPVFVANQDNSFLFRCDAERTVYRADAGTVTVVAPGGGIHRFPASGILIADGECGQPATHAWRVHNPTSGRTWIIARCSTGRHAAMIRRYIRRPDCTYRVVDYLLPVEMATGRPPQGDGR